MKYNNIICKNIYYMLQYAIEEIGSLGISYVGIEDIKGIDDIYIELFYHELDKIINNGMVISYKMNSNIITNRPYGSIDYIKTCNDITGALLGQYHCNVNETSFNNIYNQIIKATARLLLSKQDEITRDNEVKLSTYINKLSAIGDIKLSNEILNRYREIPNWYKPMYALSRMILNDSLVTDDNNISSSEMFYSTGEQRRLHYIFETFIRNYYSRTIDSSIVSKESYRIATFTRQPDATIRIGNSTILLDAKWKENGNEDTSNINQIITYIAAYRENTGFDTRLSAALVYAQCDNDKDTIEYQGSISSLNAAIYICRLNVNKDWGDIKSDLDTIIQALY